ncbi:DUF1003 domain-containing protein [Candidatus Peregrinibacteria bacterium]|nr:DUF1003 domain-containing protein [Candidatus Peregrinibacteria bacterium]
MPTKNTHQEYQPCSICGRVYAPKSLFPSELIRDGIAVLIRKKNPDWDGTGYVCQICLNQYRTEYVEKALKMQKGEVSALERKVLKGLKEHDIVAQDINTAFDRQLTVGERVADKVATFGGSWKFVISFGAFIFIWIIINVILLVTKPFDPYPFILLNLMLSCLAAIQAPIIMMSQNRMEDRDRMRSEEDYKVNLKAELEIRHLNEKLDHLLNRQWQRLLEIQQIQLDLMEEMAARKGKAMASSQPVATPAVVPAPASAIPASAAKA